MKEDGFAQGAIKAGAKGGIIGAGIYTIKAGAAKVGSAISASSERLGGRDAGDGDYSASNQPADNTGNNAMDKNDSGAFIDTNPSAYQDSRRFEDFDNDGAYPFSDNTQDYNPSDSGLDAVSHPVLGGRDDNGSDTGDSGLSSTSPYPDDYTNGSRRQNSKPSKESLPDGTPPISAVQMSANSKGWNKSNSPGNPTAPVIAPVVASVHGSAPQSNISPASPPQQDSGAGGIAPRTQVSPRGIATPIQSGDTLALSVSPSDTRPAQSYHLNAPIPNTSNAEEYLDADNNLTKGDGNHNHNPIQAPPNATLSSNGADSAGFEGENGSTNDSSIRPNNAQSVQAAQSSQPQVIVEPSEMDLPSQSAPQGGISTQSQTGHVTYAQSHGQGINYPTNYSANSNTRTESSNRPTERAKPKADSINARKSGR
jgi:hypothetical protein